MVMRSPSKKKWIGGQIVVMKRVAIASPLP